MTEPDPVELIDLADEDGNRCVVRVTGRYRPGVLTGHDTLRAEVLASADFVDARLELHLLPEDLDAWQHGLDRLAPGEEATIGSDRGLTLGVRLHEDDGVSVTVDDPGRLTALLGIRPVETWIAEHRQRLDRVRETWPREVVETAPMAYEWSPHRRR